MVKSQLYQFQNQNNMPSKDGIFREGTQLAKWKDTILNIPLSMQVQNI